MQTNNSEQAHWDVWKEILIRKLPFWRPRNSGSAGKKEISFRSNNVEFYSLPFAIEEVIPSLDRWSETAVGMCALHTP